MGAMATAKAPETKPAVALDWTNFLAQPSKESLAMAGSRMRGSHALADRVYCVVNGAAITQSASALLQESKDPKLEPAIKELDRIVESDKLLAKMIIACEGNAPKEVMGGLMAELGQNLKARSESKPSIYFELIESPSEQELAKRVYVRAAKAKTPEEAVPHLAMLNYYDKGGWGNAYKDVIPDEKFSFYRRYDFAPYGDNAPVGETDKRAIELGDRISTLQDGFFTKNVESLYEFLSSFNKPLSLKLLQNDDYMNGRKSVRAYHEGICGVIGPLRNFEKEYAPLPA